MRLFFIPSRARKFSLLVSPKVDRCQEHSLNLQAGSRFSLSGSFITGFIGYRRAHIVCRALYRFPANIFLRVRAAANRVEIEREPQTRRQAPGIYSRESLGRAARAEAHDEADFVAGGNARSRRGLIAAWRVAFFRRGRPSRLPADMAPEDTTLGRTRSPCARLLPPLVNGEHRSRPAENTRQNHPHICSRPVRNFTLLRFRCVYQR